MDDRYVVYLRAAASGIIMLTSTVNLMVAVGGRVDFEECEYYYQLVGMRFCIDSERSETCLFIIKPAFIQAGWGGSSVT